MESLLRCECGFAARGDDEAELAAEVRRHAWEAHGMELSPDEALRLVVDRGTTYPPGESTALADRIRRQGRES